MEICPWEDFLDFLKCFFGFSDFWIFTFLDFWIFQIFRFCELFLNFQKIQKEARTILEFSENGSILTVEFCG